VDDVVVVGVAFPGTAAARIVAAQDGVPRREVLAELIEDAVKNKALGTEQGAGRDGSRESATGGGGGGISIILMLRQYGGLLK
jgi:hypothetical protein